MITAPRLQSLAGPLCRVVSTNLPSQAPLIRRRCDLFVLPFRRAHRRGISQWLVAVPKWAGSSPGWWLVLPRQCPTSLAGLFLPVADEITMVSESEFDVDFDGPDFATEAAAPPGVIVIPPRPLGYDYDLSQLPFADVERLLEDCKSEYERHQRIKLDRLLVELRDLTRRVIDAGYDGSADELLREIGKPQHGQDGLKELTPALVAPAKSTPRYRDLVDPSRTWSGRGKRPDWLKTMINLYGEEAALKQCLIIQRDELPFAGNEDEPE